MNRLEKIANRVTAEDKTFAETRIEEALNAISYLPVEHHMQDSSVAADAKRLMNTARESLEKLLMLFPTPVTFTIYGTGNPVKFDNEKDLMDWARRKGIRQIGLGGNQLRDILRGKPAFDKLNGPMYDGPKKVRYETQEVTDQLSR